MALGLVLWEEKLGAILALLGDELGAHQDFAICILVQFILIVEQHLIGDIHALILGGEWHILALNWHNFICLVDHLI